MDVALGNNHTQHYGHESNWESLEDFNDESQNPIGAPTYGYLEGALASKALWISSFFCSTVGNVATAMTDAIKANVLDDNHPWKQKKYENALQEWRNGFLEITNMEIEVLHEQLQLDLIAPASPLKEMLIAVLRVMMQTHDDYRSKYYEILVQLREVLMSQAYSEALTSAQIGGTTDPILSGLLALCESRYNNVHLYNFCECLVDAVIAQGEGDKGVTRLSHKDFDVIDHACYSSMGAVRLAVNKGKFQGFVNVNFDPAMQQNIPFVLADLPLTPLEDHGGEPMVVRLLRFGTPTIEGYVQRACVAPEFANFLVALQFQKKKHLYISLQSDIPQMVGDESERNRVIKELQLKHGNFFSIVLDQDSPFYKQKGEFVTLTREEFKEEIRKRIYSDDHGYYFPAGWKEDYSFIRHIERLQEMAFAIAFEEGEDYHECSKSERCAYMEVLHSLLVLFCIRYSGVNSVNVSCKDSIDRAMKTVSIILQMFMVAQGNADNPEYQKIHKVFNHAPAFMVKKQAMIVGRRSCMLSTYDLLDSAKGRRFIAQHAAELGFQGSSFSVKRKSGQTF